MTAHVSSYRYVCYGCHHRDNNSDHPNVLLHSLFTAPSYVCYFPWFSCWYLTPPLLSWLLVSSQKENIFTNTFNSLLSPPLLFLLLLSSPRLFSSSHPSSSSSSSSHLFSLLTSSSSYSSLHLFSPLLTSSSSSSSSSSSFHLSSPPLLLFSLLFLAQCIPLSFISLEKMSDAKLCCGPL